MSNNNFSYGLPYSSVRPQQPPFQQVPENRQPSPKTSTSITGHGFQTAAEIANPYDATQYQSQRYSQQRQPGSDTSFNWYGRSMGGGTLGQRNGNSGSNEVQGNQHAGTAMLSSQGIYETSGLRGYSHPSGLEYGLSESTDQQVPGGSSGQNKYIDKVSDDIGIPYQPYMGRSYEPSRQTATNLSPSLPATSQSRQDGSGAGQVAVIKDTASYLPLKYCSAAPMMNTNSQVRVAMNSAVPRSGPSSNATNRNSKLPNHDNIQYGYSSPQSSAQGRLPGPQTTQGSGTQNSVTTPSAAHKHVPKVTKRQEQQYRASQAPSQPIVRHTKSSSINNVQNQQSSILKILADDVRQITRPIAHQPLSQSSADLPTSQKIDHTSQALDNERDSPSTYLPQALQEKSSIASKADRNSHGGSSVTVATTVDPSHVYNQYHEYQKQIEAADAEHAKLAALKAESEVAEAAAARALVQDKSVHSPETRTEASQMARVRSPNAKPTESLPAKELSVARRANSKHPENVLSNADTEGADKAPSVAAMEAEMRLMVEKMRQYQTKDPKLFSRVWEAVKKTQSSSPGQQRSSAEPDSIQSSHQLEKASPNLIASLSQRTTPPALLDGALDPPLALATASPKRKSRATTRATEWSKAKAAYLAVEKENQAKVYVSPWPPVENDLSNWSPLESAGEPPDAPNILAEAPKQPLEPEAALESEMASANAQPAPRFGSLVSQSSATDTPKPYHDVIQTRYKGPIKRHVPIQPLDPLLSTKQMTAQATPESRGPPLAQSPYAALAGRDRVNVIWPEADRDIVATTAANVLNALPENSGRKLLAHQIRDMLEYNPSYLELCKLIEGIGFKIDRARFAKSLLAVISSNPIARAQGGRIDSSHKRQNARDAQVPEDPSQSAEPILQNKPVVAVTDNQIDAGIHPETSRTPGAPAGPGVSIPASLRDSADHSSRPRSTFQGQSGIGKEEAFENVLRSTQVNSVVGSAEPKGSSVERRGPGRPRKDGTEPKGGSVERRRPGRPRKHGLPPQLRWPQDRNTVANNPALTVTRHSISQRRPGGSLASQFRHASTQDVAWEENALEDNPRQFRPTALHKRPVSLEQTPNAILVRPIQYFSPYPPLSKPLDTNGKGQRSSTSATKKMNGEQPFSITKELAARKRTFAEIIDLTVDEIDASANKDHSPSQGKVRRIEPQGDKCYGGAEQPLHAEPEPRLIVSTTTLSLEHLDTTPTPAPSVNAVVNPLKNFDHIVSPIDKSVALRRSWYNSRTVARDILITTARHLFHRGLNAHLEQLKYHFDRVDEFSDLSTLRWDMIDPGGLPVGSANTSASANEPLSKLPQNIKGSNRSKNGPEGLRLPVGRGRLRPTRGGSSLRGSRGAERVNRNTTPAHPSGLRYSRGLESNIAVVIEPGLPLRLPSISQTKGQHDTPDNFSITRPRLGRPPKQPDHESLSPPTIRRVGRPPKTSSIRGRILHEQTKRKVGRPRVHSLSESTSKGKRAKPDPNLTSPKFVAFLCEWRGCKAELHNLETLRRHILTVHYKQQQHSSLACYWGKCSMTSQDEAASFAEAANGHHVFDDIDALEDHVEKAHLIPFSWHMGDGPRGSTLDGSETDRSAYLSDMADRVTITSSTSQGTKWGAPAKVKSTWRPAWENGSFDPTLDSAEDYLTPEIRAGFNMPETGDWKWVQRKKRSVSEQSKV